MATDNAGNVLLTGYFTGAVSFGGGSLSAACPSAVFLTKLKADGSHVWSKRFGGLESHTATGVAADALGNVIVTGTFSGTDRLWSGISYGTQGSPSAFLAKFDAAGKHLWSKRFGDASTQSANGVATDTDGNVVVTGKIYGTVDFGGGPLTSAGDSDVFVAKFDGAGKHLWSKRFGDADQQDASGIVIDAAGNVLL